MSSGLEGLMGMRTLSRRVTYPEVLIVRPLLTCSKEDLRGLCREKGLQWVEDLSNHTPWCMRNRVRDLLCTQSDLTAACLQLHQDLKGTGEVIQRRGETNSSEMHTQSFFSKGGGGGGEELGAT